MSFDRPRFTFTSNPIFAAAIAVLVLALAPSAQATTSLDFVSSGGQFAIATNVLDFGTGLSISAASVDGLDDIALVGATILLSPLQLTGSTTSLPGGLTQIGIDSSVDYEIQIFQAAGDGGALLLSGNYDPGEFIVIGASGLISAPIADDLSELLLTAAGTGFSDVLDNLATTSDAIDFNVTLSAAGQDIAARIQSGDLVMGAVAGSISTVIPEPSTAVMMGLGLGGLAFMSRRQARFI